MTQNEDDYVSDIENENEELRQQLSEIEKELDEYKKKVEGLTDTDCNINLNGGQWASTAYYYSVGPMDGIHFTGGGMDVSVNGETTTLSYQDFINLKKMLEKKSLWTKIKETIKLPWISTKKN